MGHAYSDREQAGRPRRKRPGERVEQRSAALGLQRRAGNQATAEVLRRSLATSSLRVGPANDGAEREADSVADRVVSALGQQGASPAPLAIARSGDGGVVRRKGGTSQSKAKSQEKTEKKRLAMERELGKDQRADSKEKMSNESQTADGFKGSAGFDDIKTRFESVLAQEQADVQARVDKGESLESAQLEAYKVHWLDNKDPEIRALRPMRETRAEKLVLQVSELRSERGAEEVSKEAVLGDRGALLSKDVEKQFVEELRQRDLMMQAGKSKDEAEEEAYKQIWERGKGKKFIKKRPERGSKLEAAGYARARKRLGQPGAEKDRDEYDQLNKGSMVAGNVLVGTGIVGKVTNTLGSDGNKSTLNTSEMAGGGILNLSAGLGSAFEVVVKIKDFCFLVSDVYDRYQADQLDFNDACELLTSGLSILGKLNSLAASIMRTMTSLSESMLADLAQHIPILTVIGSSISIATSLTESLANSIRLGYDTLGVFKAREKDVPELVLALGRLGRRNTQLLEESLFTFAASATRLGLGIAQLASGGADMGASSAISGIVSGLSFAHSLGHMIADNVFAVQAKTARGRLVKRYEGSAEELLAKDASWAIDGLLVAATKGSETSRSIAKSTIEGGYGVKLSDSPSTGELSLAHDRMLKLLSESDEPKTLLDKAKEGLESIKKIGDGTKASDVRTLAAARDKGEGKGDDEKRSAMWKLKMWTKSAGALERRIAQENVKQGTAGNETPYQTEARKRTAKYEGTGRSEADVKAGKFLDPKDLLAEIENMTSKECLAESTNEKRSTYERAMFHKAFELKLAEEQAAIAQPLQKSSAKELKKSTPLKKTPKTTGLATKK